MPDAADICHAIGSVLELVRSHNDSMAEDNVPDQRIKIIFVQHSDSDPDDPLYKGKATWRLVFEPRDGDEAEVLVHKDVGTSAKRDSISSWD